MKPLGASLWHCQPGLSSWPEEFLAFASLFYNHYKLRQVPLLLDCKTVRIFAYSSTPRFTDFFTDFEKKTDCFAVYPSASSRAARNNLWVCATVCKISLQHVSMATVPP